jgi:hypothetical protein
MGQWSWISSKPRLLSECCWGCWSITYWNLLLSCCSPYLPCVSCFYWMHSSWEVVAACSGTNSDYGSWMQSYEWPHLHALMSSSTSIDQYAKLLLLLYLRERVLLFPCEEARLCFESSRCLRMSVCLHLLSWGVQSLADQSSSTLLPFSWSCSLAR